MTRVVVRRDPGGYMSPSYWHATCGACAARDLSTYCTCLPEAAWESDGCFAPVLAWATHHAYCCPAVLVEALQDASGYRWCIDCGRVDPPCHHCNGSGNACVVPGYQECQWCGGEGIEHGPEYG